MTSPCILCEMSAGDAEASVAYEDDLVFGFMTPRPVHPGEVAVVTRVHIDHVTDLPDELAAHMWKIAMQVGRVVREEFKPVRVGFVVHGFGVPHAHMMVVPLEKSGDITSLHFVRVQNGEATVGVSHIPKTPPAVLDETARRIRDRLSRT